MDTEGMQEETKVDTEALPNDVSALVFEDTIQHSVQETSYTMEKMDEEIPTVVLEVSDPV